MSDNLIQDQGTFSSGDWPGITIYFSSMNKIGPCEKYHEHWSSLGNRAVLAIHPVYSGITKELMVLLKIKSLYNRYLFISSLGSEPKEAIVVSFGSEVAVKLHQGFGFMKNQNMRLQLGVYTFLMQKLFYSFIRGNQTDTTQALINSIPTEVYKYLLSEIQLSESQTKYQKHLYSFIRGDQTDTTQALINSLTMEIYKFLLSEIQLSGSQMKYQKHLQVLSDDSIEAVQSLLNSILENNEIYLFQKITQSLEEIQTQFLSTPPSEIYLDGRPLSKRA